MLYIKDYRSIRAFEKHDPESHPPNVMQIELIGLIGKNISVFVDSGGCMTGILIEVLPDSIKLITRLPQISRCNAHNACSRPGTNTYISLNHIAAVVYQSL